MLAAGQFEIDGREVERIVFDREFMNAVRDQRGQSAMPVENVEEFDALAPDPAHLEREEVEQKTFFIGRRRRAATRLP